MMSFSPDPVIAEQQMHAIIYYLTAFAYIDGDFDLSEKGFIEGYIHRLVDHRARDAMKDTEESVLKDVVSRWTKHFHEVFSDIDHQIRGHFDEPVADGEDQTQFVRAKLKLRCFELFNGFDEDNRGLLLSTVDELMHADGTIHPAEQQFRDELEALLTAPIDLEEAEMESLEEGDVVIDGVARIAAPESDHPFFQRHEFDYSADKETFGRQTAADMDVVSKAMAKLDEQRAGGAGKLASVADVRALVGHEQFLDGHTYVLHPTANKDYELLVLGDLHGCYSCLKGALLQANFFEKVQAHHDAPDKHPEMKLVLLGDYIDRGRFSYNGILRTVLQLFLAVPDHVFPLRGNHEYYVELNGRVYGAVKPSEAMTSLKDKASNDLFAAYMRLFEALPNSLIFDRTLFVHAGIPRDDTLAEKWKGPVSMNDPEIRFQMLWSDPSETDFIPLELQKASARFPFGKKQFRQFLAKLQCNTMVRGHEKVTEGFKEVYADPDARLLNLFSAGGETNNDLPEDSSYREVTPMALTIRHRDGISQMTPFRIEYERYNDPEYNAFFKSRLSSPAL